MHDDMGFLPSGEDVAKVDLLNLFGVDTGTLDGAWGQWLATSMMLMRVAVEDVPLMAVEPS